ncbi:MAG: nicotinamide-nucleotide amidohydrolase family protein [Anaerolineae bacterium]|nr:nicotinamide-nucleotide amidohydrolase family protein [Anaerolineae bacterium]
MSLSLPCGTILAMDWVTVQKLDHEGRKVTAYAGQVIERTPTSILLATVWERPADLGYVVLAPGDRWAEHFYTDRWYNIFEIRTAGGRLRGWYCDIARPARIAAAAVSAEDLALDLWVDPQRRITLLDEDEFAGLLLGPGERDAALAAVERLRAMVAQGTGPFAAAEEVEMDELLEVAVGRLLRQRGLTLAAAESCTGGLVGHRLTNVPGSSEYYLGSVTAYAYEAKERLLGVRHATLYEHGAVSPETALEMARGIRQVLWADLGVSVTGIAGPGGGTPEKPVGLVYVALAAADGEWVERHVWPGDRQANKAASAEAVLDLLRRYLEGEEIGRSRA